MPRRNDQISRKIRQEHAAERKVARDARTDEEQVAILEARGVEGSKEMDRLKGW